MSLYHNMDQEHTHVDQLNHPLSQVPHVKHCQHELPYIARFPEEYTRHLVPCVIQGRRLQGKVHRNIGRRALPQTSKRTWLDLYDLAQSLSNLGLQLILMDLTSLE